MLRFRVKYYPADPTVLKEEFTRLELVCLLPKLTIDVVKRQRWICDQNSSSAHVVILWNSLHSEHSVKHSTRFLSDGQEVVNTKSHEFDQKILTFPCSNKRWNCIARLVKGRGYVQYTPDPVHQGEPSRATLNMFQNAQCGFFKLWSIRSRTLGKQ